MARERDIMLWWSSFVDEMAAFGYDLNNPADRAMIRVKKELDTNNGPVEFSQSAFIKNNEFENFEDSEFAIHERKWFLENQIEPDFDRISELYEEAKEGNVFVINNVNRNNKEDSFRFVYVKEDNSALVSKTPAELNLDKIIDDDEVDNIYRDEFNGEDLKTINDKLVVTARLMESLDGFTFNREALTEDQFMKEYGIDIKNEKSDKELYFKIENLKLNYYIENHKAYDNEDVKNNQQYKIVLRGGIDPEKNSAIPLREDDEKGYYRREDVSIERHEYLTEERLVKKLISPDENGGLSELEKYLAGQLGLDENILTSQNKDKYLNVFDAKANPIKDLNKDNVMTEKLMGDGLYYWKNNEPMPHKIFYNKFTKSIVDTNKQIEEPKRVAKPGFFLRMVDKISGIFGFRVESVKKYEDYLKEQNIFEKMTAEKNIKTSAFERDLDYRIEENKKENIIDVNIAEVIDASADAENEFKNILEVAGSDPNKFEDLSDDIKKTNDNKIANVVLENILTREKIYKEKNPNMATPFTDYTVNYGAEAILNELNETEQIKNLKDTLTANKLDSFITNHGKDIADGVIQNKSTSINNRESINRSKVSEVQKDTSVNILQ